MKKLLDAIAVMGALQRKTQNAASKTRQLRVVVIVGATGNTLLLQTTILKCSKIVVLNNPGSPGWTNAEFVGIVVDWYMRSSGVGGSLLT